MTSTESATVIEALEIPRWKDAMIKEYLALLRNHSRSLVTPLVDRKATGCKWVFKIKENPNRSVLNYKARLVVKGF